MKSQPVEINKPCNRCAARMLKIVGVILLLGLASVVLMELAHGAASPLCACGLI